MQTVILAVLSILLSVAAQFALKAGARACAGCAAWAMALQPMVLFGLCLYGLSAVVWLSVLAKWDVSKAYPMVGFGFAISVGVGAALGEPVTAARWAGVALICAGVLLIGRT
jgi:multidrug transporter EmrE-like cation transporter